MMGLAKSNQSVSAGTAPTAKRQSQDITYHSWTDITNKTHQHSHVCVQQCCWMQLVFIGNCQKGLVG